MFQEVGSLESGGRFYIVAFGRNLFPVAVNVLLLLIYYIEKYYNCCMLTEIYNYNTPVNCITLQQRTYPFKSSLTGDNTRVV